MPALNEIRTAIADKILSAAPAVAAHDYERYTKSMSDLAAMYKAADSLDANAARLNGYHVRRVSTREVLVDTGRWSVWHRWRIRGIMSLDDADETEKLFDEQIETIRTAFRDDEDLGGLIFGTTDKYKLMEALDPDWNGALPHTLLLGPDGKVLYRQSGELDFLELRRKIVPALNAISPWKG